MDLKGSKWIQINTHGSEWILLDPLVRIDLCRLKWIQINLMDPNGSKWIQMDPNWSQWILMDPNESKLIKMNPTGSKLIQMDPTGCNWRSQLFQMDKIDLKSVRLPDLRHQRPLGVGLESCIWRIFILGKILKKNGTKSYRFEIMVKI